MIQFRLLVLSLSLIAAALLVGCGDRDAGAADQAADVSRSTPGANRQLAERHLPEECQEALAEHRACVENIAASFERAGQVAGAKAMREALPAEVEETRARWLRMPSAEGLRQSCIAMRDTIRAQPQCKP